MKIVHRDMRYKTDEVLHDPASRLHLAAWASSRNPASVFFLMSVFTNYETGAETNNTSELWRNSPSMSFRVNS